MSETKTVDRAAEVLSGAAANVLETMFFAMLEPEECEPDGDSVECSRVDFTGSWSGAVEVRLPAAGAAAIATDFLGLEFGDEPASDQIGHVTGELANMICGAALSRLDPDGTFDLRTPQRVAELTPSESSVTADLYLEDGPLTVQLLTK